MPAALIASCIPPSFSPIATFLSVVRLDLPVFLDVSEQNDIVSFWFLSAVFLNVTDEQAKQIAFRENAANEESIPMTFVDFAEFIWKQTGTQQQTADVLGWSRGKVSQYDMLDNISKEAWAIIATTFEEQEKLPAKSSVAANATVVAFSERLLRDIINLSDSQQLELVKDFANGVINKNKFTKLAEQYKQMNADALSLRVAVGDLVSDEILEEGIDVGYLDTKPVIVNSKNEIIEGNHRVAACRALGIESVPVIIKDVSSENDTVSFSAFLILIAPPPPCAPFAVSGCNSK